MISKKTKIVKISSRVRYITLLITISTIGYYYRQDYYIQSKGQIPYYTTLCNSILALLLLSSPKHSSIESLKGLQVLFVLISLVRYTWVIESRGVIGERYTQIQGQGAQIGSELSSRVSKELRVRDITTKCNTSIKFGLDKGPKPLYNRELVTISSILSFV